MLALERVGAFVQSLAAVGKGCPDLLVRHRGRWLLMEVKDGAKTASQRDLTAPQVTWHRRAGVGAVQVVLSVEDALRVIAE